MKLRSFLCNGLGVVLDPWLGAADDTITNAVSSVSGCFAAHAADIFL